MLVGYARVSTLDQNPDLQMDALQEAGCERTFTETASGAQRDRPQLAAALDYMRTGDTLVVWRLDRLARRTLQLLETIENLKDRGMHFQSLRDKIDTTTPHGMLYFTVLGAVAEFERSVIQERVLAGLAAARARGRVGGRPRALSDDDLRAARAMLKDGSLTVAEVARRVGVSPATLYRYVPSARASAREDAP